MPLRLLYILAPESTRHTVLWLAFAAYMQQWPWALVALAFTLPALRRHWRVDAGEGRDAAP